MKIFKRIIISCLVMLLCVYVLPVNSINATELDNSIFQGSWASIGRNYLLSKVKTIAIDPKNPDIVYLGTNGEGVFKSNDGGETFEPINNNLSESYINAIIIDPDNPNVIYTGTATGIFKSFNGGRDWEEMDLGMGRLEVLSLAFDPANSQIIYAGVYNEKAAGGIFRSKDGGNSWENIGLQSEQVNSITITIGENSFIYAGTGSGVFRSVDSGTTWVKSSFNKAANVIKLGSANLIYIASFGGVYKSIDSGTTWILTGLKDNNVISLDVDPNNQEIVYAGTDDGRFFRCINGNTWEEKEIVAKSINCIAVDSKGNLYLGKDRGFSKSFDMGNTFKTADYPLYAETVTVDPVDENILYVGTDNGIFQSEDKGLSWERIGLDNFSAISIAVDSKNHNVVYAGTALKGIFKSVDGGKSWSDITPWAVVPSSMDGKKFLSVNSIIFDFSDSSKIFLGTSEGVLKSVDSGSTWQSLGPRDNNDRNIAVLCIQIDPISSEVVYIGTKYFGMFKSVDGGLKWNNIGFMTCTVSTFSVNPKNPKEIMVGTFSKLIAVADKGKPFTPSDSGLFISTDGGTFWQKVSLASSDNYSFLSIVHNPSNPKNVFAVALFYIGFIKDKSIYFPVFLESTDGGVTWKTTDTPKTILSMSSMCIDDISQIVYIGTHGGVYKYEINTEKGYFQSSGFGDSEISTLLTVNGTLFAGSFNGTIGKSVDNGKTWQYKAQYSNIIRALVQDPKDSSTIYAGTSLGILKSEDGGISWGKIDSLNKDINTLLVSPQNSNIMYAGTVEGIFKSVDGASSWVASSNGLTEGEGVYSLTFDPANSSTLYAVTSNGIFKSVDYANSWTLKKSSEERFYTITFVDSNTIFVGTDEGILKSSDSGETWEETHIEDTKVFSIKVDLKGNIFLGTDSGVLVSNDNGNSFTPLENGLTNYSVSSIAIDSNGNIYAGTIGSGIFKFISKKYVIEAKANAGGSIKPEGGIELEEGASQTIKITPSLGYKIKDVKIDGSSVGAVTTYTFENITADHTIEALFEPLTFTIVASAGTGGTIIPSGTVPLTYGESKSFTIAAEYGYKIKDVKIDGNSVGGVTTYTFTNITSNHTISAFFEKEITQTIIILPIGSTSFTVNGEARTFDSPPVIKNSRTLLPIRAVVEALGGTVDWDNAAKKVTVTLKSTHVELWIGNPQAKVNGATKWIDETNHKVVPEIINGRTMIPLRFVAENLGAKVDWNSDTKTITITYSAT